MELFINIESWPALAGGAGHFQYCTGLQSIIIPCPKSGTLARAMFSNCTKLKTAVIKEGVTRINGQFFQLCTSLGYVELPSTLAVFGAFSGSVYQQFNHVSGSIILKAATPPSAVNGVFTNFSGKFYVPDNSVAAYKAATGWSSIAARIFPLSEYER